MMDDRDPYAEGVDAFMEGLSETANPYDPETEEEAHCSWNDGWHSGGEDEE